MFMRLSLTPPDKRTQEFKEINFFYSLGATGPPTDATTHFHQAYGGELMGDAENISIEPFAWNGNHFVTIKAVIELMDGTTSTEFYTYEDLDTISIESFTTSWRGGTSNIYDFEAVVRNQKPNTMFYVRSQAGDPECQLPDIIPVSPNNNAERMALELQASGMTYTIFNPNTNFTITLILADDEGNILDFASICQDWLQDL